MSAATTAESVTGPLSLMGLTSAAAAERLALDGPNDVPEPKSHPVLLFARKFWGLSAWMIELMAAISFVLGKKTDLLIALALLLVNAIMSFLQEQRALSAVRSLRRQLQVSARVLRDGSWRVVDARDLVRGDVVRVRAGDFIPADARVTEGALLVDQSALTGEAHAIGRAQDDTLFSGAIVRQGEATAVVTATGIGTYFGRTTQLVASAHPKLHIEAVVTRVVKWMFLIVGTLVSVAVIAAFTHGLPADEILPLTLLLLMGAVPVALPVMFTLTMAVGSIALGRKGVLVTRLSAAEDAANMDVVCADKTGTLTLNRLSLAAALPASGATAEDVIRDGALASNSADQDPIDLAFLRAAGARQLLDGTVRTLSFLPFSAASRRTEATIERDGRICRVTKGALRTVAEAAGFDARAVAMLEARAEEEAQKGFRVLAVGRAEDGGPLRLIGLALLRDAPRSDSRPVIDQLHALGVSVKMLTGDALPVARSVARELGLGDIVRAPDLHASAGADRDLVQGSSGFAEIFPEDKFLVVKSLQDAGHVVGMTGDGVNDAPALRQAEVGIAVCGASDAAKGAASVVLTTEGLSSIVDLVMNGRAIYQRILTWIINKVSRTILKSGLVVIALLVTGKFVISALGMILLLFMTDFVKIALSTDRVRPSLRPATWDIGPQVALGVIMGVAMLAEALGLLAIGWHGLGLGGETGRLQTFTFQMLLFFAVFSILSIRERRAFWRSWPSGILVLALIGDALAGIAVGLYGLGEMQPVPPVQTLCIIVYASICCLGVNDLGKTAFVARYWPVPPIAAFTR